ncbi:MAG TPA: DNA-processing protein DprA [Vicinamibacterales bacterium]
MTHDHALALSFAPSLPRVGLTDRLRADDPLLVELAATFLPRAVDAREAAARRGVRTVAWNDAEFPPHLLTLSDAPPALWYRGTLSCLARPGVALVGARAASRVALDIAHRLGADLAARGVTVVSGLARGVDSAAHRGALTTGRTAAVLGGGVCEVYPSEHAALAAEIAATGVVVSEFPPGTPPLPHHFPMRNRLISGLARVVVVVEAAEKSGSLITAGCALEQGREVMAVPGSVQYGRNRGGHALIRDGAKIVETVDDIVGELQGGAPLVPGGEPGSTLDASSSSGLLLLSVMVPGEPYDLDALIAASGLDGPAALRAMTDLELAGLVQRTGAGCCIRVS